MSKKKLIEVLEENKRKSHFVMRYNEDNVYDCKECQDENKKHKVISQKHRPTDSGSWCGAGTPTTIRICTNCKNWDGPWVSADIVGGFI